MPLKQSNISLLPVDNKRLANLCGQFDEHLHQIEKHLNVHITSRGNMFLVKGNSAAVGVACTVLQRLYQEADDEELTPAKIHLNLQQYEEQTQTRASSSKADFSRIQIHTKSGAVQARSANQFEYLQRIKQYDISFGIGPAGTGKTYLAVACAVDALEKGKMSRIVLVRPAVEAGERLGFLPGDLAQKVDPYLRPLYDALSEMFGFERVAKLVERNVIEVAPLAYMRGRTLNDAFIILDESQNTTPEQMKMFLTRVGFGSKVVVTGDITQVDLPRGQYSGLRHAIDVLSDVDGVSFTYLMASDVIRHPIVQAVVEAYAVHDKKRDDS